MSKYKKHFEFQVGGWAVHPLIYGDWGELDPGDEFKLEEFISHIYTELGKEQPLVWICNEQEPHFAKCDVSGLHDMVYDITMYIY